MAYTSVESTVATLISNQPPVIIMHGLLGCKAHWSFITRGLHRKTRRKVYAVDARNHGESEHSSEMTLNHLVEDIRGFMQTMSIKKALLIGHGMGAQAMMSMALKHPDVVDQLIVVDTSPISSSPSLYLTPTYLSAINSVVLPPMIPLSVAKQAADTQLRRAVPGKILRKILLANLVPAGNSRYKWRINLTAIARNFINISTFPTATHGQVFERPTLFVQGGRSDNIKRTDLRDIRRLFPKAEFKRFASTGHWLHLQRPREFVGVVGDFITMGEERDALEEAKKGGAVGEVNKGGTVDVDKKGGTVDGAKTFKGGDGSKGMLADECKKSVIGDESKKNVLTSELKKRLHADEVLKSGIVYEVKADGIVDKLKESEIADDKKTSGLVDGLKKKGLVDEVKKDKDL